jgi:hypothetical protein
MARHPLPKVVTIALVGLPILLVTAHAEDDTNDEIVALVIGLLAEPDIDMRALALEQIRTEVRGEKATKRIAAELPKLPADVQVEVVRALTDRGDAAARPAIVSLLDETKDDAVRAGALRALGYLGEERDWKLLATWLSKGSGEVQQTARASLIRLPVASVSKTIAKDLNNAEPPLRIALMQILVERRAFDVAKDLLPYAIHADPKVRTAAMSALGQLGSTEHVPGMVQGILTAEPGKEREAAEKAVMLVCQRIENTDEQAAPLLAAMDDISEAERITVLPTLGRVGGTAALEVVSDAITDSDPERHEAGLRALCNWPDASIAGKLLTIVKTEEDNGHRTMALRSLIRIAPLPDGRSEMEKLEQLKQALPFCERDEERKLVLDRARAIRIPETLRFLLPYLDEPEFAEQACFSIVELAHHRSLREPNKQEFHEALEKVKATTEDATVRDRAGRYQRGETWARPKR